MCRKDAFWHTRTIWQSKLCWLLLWLKNVIKSKEMCWYILTNFLGIHNAPRKSLSYECGFEVRAKWSNNFPWQNLIYNLTLSKRLSWHGDLTLVGSLSLEVRVNKLSWKLDGMWHGDLTLVGSLSLEVRVNKLSWKLDGMWPIVGCCWVVRKQNSRVIPKVTLSSQCLWVSFHPPLPSFTSIHNVKTFLLNLSMKCWNSAFNESRNVKTFLLNLSMKCWNSAFNVSRNVKTFLLNLSMKCWNSAFNDSRKVKTFLLNLNMKCWNTAFNESHNVKTVLLNLSMKCWN
jgi:hypothetical protein